MDGTSPGNMPTSLGNVWVGETKWFGGGVVCGGGITPFGWEPWPGVNAACAAAPFTPFVHPLLDQRRPFSANPDDWYRKLSDADVERIARRAAEIVVELLRAPILPRRETHISPDLVAIAAETEDSEP